jgi:hypothetical protein
MSNFGLQLPTPRTYSLGRCGDAHVYLERTSISLTPYYIPEHIGEKYHPCNDVDNVFVNTKESTHKSLESHAARVTSNKAKRDSESDEIN